MKKLILLSLLFGSLTIFAQNDTIHWGNWTVMGKVSANFSQSYFSNWSAGGTSSFTGIGKYTMSADFNKGKHSWTNWLDLALGYSIFAEQEPKYKFFIFCPEKDKLKIRLAIYANGCLLHALNLLHLKPLISG